MASLIAALLLHLVSIRGNESNFCIDKTQSLVNSILPTESEIAETLPHAMDAKWNFGLIQQQLDLTFKDGIPQYHKGNGRISFTDIARAFAREHLLEPSILKSAKEQWEEAERRQQDLQQKITHIETKMDEARNHQKNEEVETLKKEQFALHTEYYQNGFVTQYFGEIVGDLDGTLLPLPLRLSATHIPELGNRSPSRHAIEEAKIRSWNYLSKARDSKDRKTYAKNLKRAQFYFLLALKMDPATFEKPLKP